MVVACEKILFILTFLLLHIPGITQGLNRGMEKSKLMSQGSDCAACVPLKRRETPDAFQVVMAELLHVEQRLVLPAAEHAEGLRVEVLQQRQLRQQHKVGGLFTTCLTLFHGWHDGRHLWELLAYLNALDEVPHGEVVV